MECKAELVEIDFARLNTTDSLGAYKSNSSAMVAFIKS
jgi:hypothetical protein